MFNDPTLIISHGIVITNAWVIILTIIGVWYVGWQAGYYSGRHND